MKIRMKASQVVGVSAHGMEVSCLTQTELVSSADLLSMHTQLTSVSCVSWVWQCVHIVMAGVMEPMGSFLVLLANCCSP